MDDFTTDNVRVVATVRYSFGYSSWTHNNDGAKVKPIRPDAEFMKLYETEIIRAKAARWYSLPWWRKL